MRRYDRIILLALVVVFGVGFVVTARTSLRSYVDLAEARQTGRSVQIKGTVVPDSLRIIDGRSFRFIMEDKSGAWFPVIHTGGIPVNLLEAPHVVVAGRYHLGAFVSRRILVSCPTKFQVGERPARPPTR